MSSLRTSKTEQKYVRDSSLLRAPLLIYVSAVKLTLSVHYPDDYPNVLPDLALEAAGGELEDREKNVLLSDLQTVVGNFSFHS